MSKTREQLAAEIGKRYLALPQNKKDAFRDWLFNTDYMKNVVSRKVFAYERLFCLAYKTKDTFKISTEGLLSFTYELKFGEHVEYFPKPFLESVLRELTS